MKNFEYAQPQNVTQLLSLLSPDANTTALLGGGTDLMGLMRSGVVAPDRVVNICEVAEMRVVERIADTGELAIGASLRLEEIHEHPLLDSYPGLHQAICGTRSLQFQSQSTLGGELCRRPRCWYFRDGHGLLADGGRLVEQGDNRYHAILNNQGGAKFVNASRLAPALIALGARAVIVGPEIDYVQTIQLEDLYRTPEVETERENILQPNQVLAQILLPDDAGLSSASYEVRHGEGPDDPLAASAAALRIEGGKVREAKIVLGQVAPTPVVSQAASELLIGKSVNETLAHEAGRAAIAQATPLSNNDYKVQLAEVAVARAILKAAQLPTGGFEG